MTKKIFIAAGGTGGHVFPGLAIAAELRTRASDLEMIFIGTDRGLEKELVPQAGFRLIKLQVGRIKGESKVKKVFSMAGLPIAVLKSIGIVTKEKPSLIVSVGGYCAGPISLAGKICGVPVAVLEPNAVPGFSNRMISKFADRVFVAFDAAKKVLGEGKSVNTGTPVRREVLGAVKNTNNDDGRFNVLVIGGSQGSRKLNEEVSRSAQYLSDMKDKIHFIHQTGKDESANSVASTYKKAEISAEIFDFRNDIWNAYAKADFAISRSGASAITELAVLQIPAVLVPYPFAADDHQKANATELAKKQCAIMIPDGEFTAQTIAGIIREMATSPARIAEMKQNLSKLDFANAAKKIADECIRMLG